MKQRSTNDVEAAAEFLGYLRRHPASNELAESIAELVATRRAAAARRARNKLKMISVEIQPARLAG